jgi:hypothetical protein
MLDQHDKTRHHAERGIGLIEVIVALALSGIVVYAALVLFDSMAKQQAIGRAWDARNTLVTVLFALGDRASPLIRFEDFQASHTLWRGTDFDQLPKLVAPASVAAPAFRAPTALGGDLFYRNSWTFEISRDLEMRRDTANQGFLASRCIPKTDASREKFDIKRIKSYEYYPVPLGADRSTRIQCCKIGKSKLSACQPLNAQSQFRLRLFHGHPSALLAYPKKSDAQYISGAGVFAFFNRGSAPTAMAMLVFTVDNECHRQEDFNVKIRGDKCSEASIFHGKMLERTVTSNVHDSGLMRLGR